MNNNINIEKSIKIIDKLYNPLSYFDQYGTSVIIFVVITLFVFLVHSYCMVMQTSNKIKEDWLNQRCKPTVMPFAGWINKPDNMTSFEYTQQNFQGCVQGILTNITGYMLQPLNYLLTSLNTMFSEIQESINNIRNFMAYMRSQFETLTVNVLNRVLNMIIPIQKMFISLIDSLGKTQGILTSGLFTMLGSYYALQSLMGAILQMVVMILIILAIIIVSLWILPFTWPVAATMSAIFLGISIPLAILIYFMTEVLHIQTDAGIPGLPHPKPRCFDKNTMIQMKNGSYKKILDIQNGDILYENNRVTATFVLDARNIKMYTLHNVVVSESHIVQYNGQWIYVRKHPEAVIIEDYNEPFVYCFNTTSKEIIINNCVFTDWDEIYDDTLSKILDISISQDTRIEKRENIHRYLQYGYYGHLTVLMQNGDKKCIRDVEIGDVLKYQNVVYGKVEIGNSDNSLGMQEMKKYHLLTSSSKFILHGELVNDYNYYIDGHLR